MNEKNDFGKLDDRPPAERLKFTFKTRKKIYLLYFELKVQDKNIGLHFYHISLLLNELIQYF